MILLADPPPRNNHTASLPSLLILNLFNLPPLLTFSIVRLRRGHRHVAAPSSLCHQDPLHHRTIATSSSSSHITTPFTIFPSLKHLPLCTSHPYPSYTTPLIITLPALYPPSNPTSNLLLPFASPCETTINRVLNRTTFS